jgi:hypothetical protein
MRSYLTAFFALLTASLLGQPRFPSLSPEASIRQKVGFTTISVTYERPAARGRTIFGELVPYGKLWRTGAGNCTRIKFDQSVLIGNKPIPARTYSLFTIPDRHEWTIILNSDTTLYGTGGYDEGKNVVRFKVKPIATERYYESLTFDIDVVPNDAELNISWEKTRVAFEIRTATDQQIAKIVNEQLLGKSKDPQLLAMGAEYYYYLGRDLETGLALINQAIAIKTNSWYYTVKIDILTKTNRYSEAIETLKLNMAYVKPNPERWTDEQLRDVLDGQDAKMKELQSKVMK